LKRQSFNEYYKYYLTLHKNPYTRLLHFIGQLVTILYTVVVVLHQHWYLVPFIPFIVYPFAWSGHYFFEQNKPAAWSNPLWSKACDWIMFWEIIRGRIKL
jgi:hypothetical protein